MSMQPARGKHHAYNMSAEGTEPTSAYGHDVDLILSGEQGTWGCRLPSTRARLIIVVEKPTGH